MKNSTLHLNRRSFLFGGAAIISRAPRFLSVPPGCTLTPEQEEGPYYVDYLKTRSDVTEGRPGVPLKLRIALVDAKQCEPLKDAAIDIWHCDAMGVYSGFTAGARVDAAVRGAVVLAGQADAVEEGDRVPAMRRDSFAAFNLPISRASPSWSHCIRAGMPDVRYTF